MQQIAICADLFRFPASQPYSDRALACLLWTLIYSNEAYLQGSGNQVPALYDSGVYWKAEEPVPGTGACFGEGNVDCEDVASWRVAELRLGRAPAKKGLPPFPGHPEATACKMPYPLPPATGGVDCWPAFFSRRTGPQEITIHIVVIWPDGFIEDPSRVLGMGGARRYG